MPWNLVCDSWVSWSFYKTTIIRQLTKCFFANIVALGFRGFLFIVLAHRST